MSSGLTTESAAIMEGYGWLNTLYDVARDGLFTKSPNNAIESVLKENLYTVFTYISFKAAENEYRENAREEIKRKSGKK